MIRQHQTLNHSSTDSPMIQQHPLIKAIIKIMPLAGIIVLISLLSQPWTTVNASDLPVVAGSNAASWLQKADSYMTAPDSSLISEVQVFEDGVKTKERSYQVYTQNPRKTIVVFLHQSEKGQKVLMKEHNFWLFLPRSKRGVRITAQQKLFGDAATGDITSIRWSGDYQGTVVSCDASSCQLELEKKRRGPTYKKIVLFVDKSNGLPQNADLYLNANKIAKKAQYSFEVVDDGYQITSVTYQSVLRKKQETIVKFTNVQEKQTPSRWYNPGFLASNTIP